jgi:hypothetical protein
VARRILADATSSRLNQGWIGDEGRKRRNAAGWTCGVAVRVVETGVDPVTPRFSGVCSAD